MKRKKFTREELAKIAHRVGECTVTQTLSLTWDESVFLDKMADRNGLRVEDFLIELLNVACTSSFGYPLRKK